MSDDRKVLVILALAPIPIVGNSILSYLALRIFGGKRRAFLFVLAGTIISIAVVSFLFAINRLLALYLIILDVLATAIGALLAYRLSSPRVRITDYYIEVEARTTKFGLNGLEPEELFNVAVNRVYWFFNQHYRNYLNEALNCRGKIRVLLDEKNKEMKVIKKCRNFSVSVTLTKGVVTVNLTVPY